MFTTITLYISILMSGFNNYLEYYHDDYLEPIETIEMVAVAQLESICKSYPKEQRIDVPSCKMAAIYYCDLLSDSDISEDLEILVTCKYNTKDASMSVEISEMD